MTTTTMGYRATRDERDALVIHDVSIFVECFRKPPSEDSEFDGNYDSKWIGEAVAKAKQAETEGYYPPLHIRHHDMATEMNDSVRPAGHFRITGTQTIRFKGKQRIAVLADLVITDPMAQHDVIADRLPYRSVEIFNVNKPGFDGLALLDHEAPFLELPMLMVSEVDGKPVRGGDVACATFGRAWSIDSDASDAPVLASFRRGNYAEVLFRNAPMQDDDDTKTVAEKMNDKVKSQGFAADDEKKPAKKKPDTTADKGEGDSGTDIKALVKSIESGAISVADMDQILAAIQNQRTETGAGNAPAPAAVPGAESMKKEPDDKSSTEFAAMQGEIEALKARDKERDAADLRRTDVATAMQRLEGRPLPPSMEESKLVEFHREHGPAAFKTYVDTFCTTFGAIPSDDPAKAAAFAGQTDKVSAVAMKYQDEGTAAVDQAEQFSREWRLNRANGSSISEEDYVANSMKRAAGTLTY